MSLTVLPLAESKQGDFGHTALLERATVHVLVHVDRVLPSDDVLERGTGLEGREHGRKRHSASAQGHEHAWSNAKRGGRVAPSCPGRPEEGAEGGAGQTARKREERGERRAKESASTLPRAKSTESLGLHAGEEGEQACRATPGRRAAWLDERQDRQTRLGEVRRDTGV